jgi:hypothetical protein
MYHSRGQRRRLPCFVVGIPSVQNRVASRVRFQRPGHRWYGEFARSLYCANLRRPKTLGRLKSTREAEQPFEFQIVIYFVWFGLVWHEFLRLLRLALGIPNCGDPITFEVLSQYSETLSTVLSVLQSSRATPYSKGRNRCNTESKNPWRASCPRGTPSHV